MRITPVIVLFLLIPASHAAAACFDHPENSIPACGFETQNDIDQWTFTSDGTVLTSSPVHSGVGAAIVSSTTTSRTEEIGISMGCFPVSGSADVRYGINVYLLSGPPGINCSVWGIRCPDVNCVDPCDIVIGITTYVEAQTWVLLTGPVAPHTPGAKLWLTCSSGAPFELVVDDAFWGEAMVPVTLQRISVE
jgi:hypothetical protein